MNVKAISRMSALLALLVLIATAPSASPQQRQSLGAADGQGDPVQDPLASERLMQVLDGNHRRTSVFPGLCTSHRKLISCDHSITRYGKKTIMIFTSTTSARITNSEARTTELVAARPTPSAPPCVRIP